MCKCVCVCFCVCFCVCVFCVVVVYLCFCVLFMFFVFCVLLFVVFLWLLCFNMFFEFFVVFCFVICFLYVFLCFLFVHGHWPFKVILKESYRNCGNVLLDFIQIMCTNWPEVSSRVGLIWVSKADKWKRSVANEQRITSGEQGL